MPRKPVSNMAYRQHGSISPATEHSASPSNKVKPTRAAKVHTKVVASVAARHSPLICLSQQELQKMPHVVAAGGNNSQY